MTGAALCTAATRSATPEADWADKPATAATATARRADARRKVMGTFYGLLDRVASDRYAEGSDARHVPPLRPASRRAAGRAARWRDRVAPGPARRHGRPGVRVWRRPLCWCRAFRRQRHTPQRRCTARSVTGCDRSAFSKRLSPLHRSWSRPSMSVDPPRSRGWSPPQSPSVRPAARRFPETHAHRCRLLTGAGSVGSARSEPRGALSAPCQAAPSGCGRSFWRKAGFMFSLHIFRTRRPQPRRVVLMPSMSARRPAGHHRSRARLVDSVTLKPIARAVVVSRNCDVR